MVKYGFTLLFLHIGLCFLLGRSDKPFSHPSIQVIAIVSAVRGGFGQIRTSSDRINLLKLVKPKICKVYSHAMASDTVYPG